MLGLFRKNRATSRKRGAVAARIDDDSAMMIVNDVSYGVADWGMDGFRALGYRRGLDNGDEVRGRLVVVCAGAPHGFNMNVRVLRADMVSGDLQGQFLDLSPKASDKLERIYADKLARQKQRARG